MDAMLAKGYALEGIGSDTSDRVLRGRHRAACACVRRSGCTLALSTEFPILGAPLEMTATCTRSPTTYAWINCIASGPTCTVNSSVAGPVLYGVVATNAQGAGAPATVTLNWQPAAAAAPSCTVDCES